MTGQRPLWHVHEPVVSHGDALTGQRDAARADADRLAAALRRLMPSEYVFDMSDDHDLIEIGSPKHVFADCREVLRQHEEATT